MLLRITEVFKGTSRLLDNHAQSLNILRLTLKVIFINKAKAKDEKRKGWEIIS